MSVRDWRGCPQTATLFTFGYDFLLLYAESSGTTIDRHAHYPILEDNPINTLRINSIDPQRLSILRLLQTFRVFLVTHSISAEKEKREKNFMSLLSCWFSFVYPDQVLGSIGSGTSYTSHSGPMAPHMSNATHNNLAK